MYAVPVDSKPEQMRLLYQEESNAIVHCMALTHTPFTFDGISSLIIVAVAIGNGEAVLLLIDRPLISDTWDFGCHVLARMQVSDIKLLNLYILKERIEAGTYTFDLLAANGRA